MHKNGNTALINLMITGRPEAHSIASSITSKVCKLLVFQRGVDIDETDKNGSTALMKCCGVDEDLCSEPELEHIQMMVDKGADVSELQCIIINCQVLLILWIDSQFQVTYTVTIYCIQSCFTK